MCMDMNVSVIDSQAFTELPADLSDVFREVGRLFYIHNITETSFKDVKQVPDFYKNAWPSFLLFIILENAVLYFQRKPTNRLNDSITSLSHGLIQECGRLVFRGSESAAYIYIHNHWMMFELPWDSPWTWYITLLAVDFLYYWVHRASHEIHIFWAQHQVHHSSEEFNVAVGLRQSLLQGWCSFVFYLPMAFFVPPAHFITHQQFNLLYQVWIHTKTIKSLGPLEYVFNTPQHHRVHHGCNIYCLDKNYGGVLIIWDRLFNTFAEEKPQEDIVYGLVYQEQSFNPLFLQVFYNQHVIEKFKSMKGIKNKLYSLIKGPSWIPGSPWTGFEKDKIDIKTRKIYDVEISFWCKLYVSIHSFAIFAGFRHLAVGYMSKNPYLAVVVIAYIILSLTSVGMILENHPKAVFYETVRITAGIVLLFCVILVSSVFKHFEDSAELTFKYKIKLHPSDCNFQLGRIGTASIFLSCTIVSLFNENATNSSNI